MAKRIFIVHGWGGNPDEKWLSWLRNELISRDFEVVSPEMPDTENPKIQEWTSYLKKIVGKCDENTFFVGHSIGCQTIIRYIESLPSSEKSGGCVFVAGWFNLVGLLEEEKEIAKPWIEKPINFKEVKPKVKLITAIFSNNDPLVPLSNIKVFEKDIGAEIIIEENKGHFSESDGVFELPSALNALLEMTK